MELHICLHEREPVEAIVSLLRKSSNGIVVCAEQSHTHTVSQLTPYVRTDRFFFVDCMSRMLGKPVHCMQNALYINHPSESGELFTALKTLLRTYDYVVFDGAMSLLKHNKQLSHLLQLLHASTNKPVYLFARQSQTSPEFVDEIAPLAAGISSENP